MEEYQSESFGSQLIQYAEAPARRPLAVLIPLVLVVTGSAIAAKMLPSRYRSSTVILVEGEKVPAKLADRVATETARNRLQTFRQEIMSRTRLETIIRELNPFPRMRSISAGVEAMRAGIWLNTKGDDAFMIEFDHVNPKMAMEVANRLAAQFIEEAGKVRAEQVAGANQFIESQLEEARKALEAKETEMRVFKEQHMGRLPQQLGSNLAALQRVQADKHDAEAALRSAEEKLEQLEKSAETVLPDGTAGAETPADLRAQLSQLRSRYTDEHPDVRALVARIEDLQQRRELARGDSERDGDPPALERARRQVEQLRERRDRLASQMEQLQTRVDLVPRTEQEETTLSRDYGKLRENYQTMLNKKMAADMGMAIEQQWKGQQFRILDPAYLPERPYFPNRRMFVLVGFLAGLGLGLLAAFALEFLDPSIKTVADLEEVVPFPVLATLPRVKTARGSAAKAPLRSAKSA